MQVGLDALRIYRAKSNVEMRKKYPIIYRDDIDKECRFNPNKTFLYFPSDFDDSTKFKNISPWYCFTLIPETMIKERSYRWKPCEKFCHCLKPFIPTTYRNKPWEKKVSSLKASLYLLRFLNWAIYYYRYLKSFYDKIPKDPNLALRTEAKKTINTFDVFMNNGSVSDQLTQRVKSIFKKNNFTLKPTLFLKLCRFFARAWYEENFCLRDSAVGSVEFAHYISNYITSDPDVTCKCYDGNNTNAKKEVAKLFKNHSALTYQFNKFVIDIQKFDNSPEDPQGNYSYSISITQFGCKHNFYLYARLRQFRYISPIVQRLHLNPNLQSIEIKVVPQDESVEPFRMSIGRYKLSEKDTGKYSLVIYGIRALYSFTDDIVFVQIEDKESNVPAEYANTFERFARTYCLSETLNTLETRVKK